jgi:hypothetical protein
MLQKKPKIFCDLSVLAIHSSIPGREPSCWSNSPVVLCREQGSMRTTEFMLQTITNDHHLWLTTPCVPKWTLHWHGSCQTRSLTTCCRRLKELPLPATPDSWRDRPSHQLEPNRHTLVTELSELGAGNEVVMNIAGPVSRAMLCDLHWYLLPPCPKCCPIRSRKWKAPREHYRRAGAVGEAIAGG